MLPSVLSTLLFSVSVIFASRSARVLGGPVANLARLFVAAGVLGLWAHSVGSGLQGPALPWLLAGGAIGFGLGDMALFGALTRVGPRLSILLTQCLAAPLAAGVEWLWLGSTLAWRELACAAAILAGVALALAPDHGWVGDRTTFWWGVVFGVFSAAGQGLGAVFTRKAYLVAEAVHFRLDGGTAAYQRILGGIVVAMLGFALLRLKYPDSHRLPTPVALKKAVPAILGNALAGPAIGVACFQWALKISRTGIVLPIVATSPLVTMLLAWMIDGMPPSRRALAGGTIAVGGAVALSLVRNHHG